MTEQAPVQNWRSLAREGRVNQALEQVESFLLKNPMNSDALVARGFFVGDADNNAAAMACFRKALLLQPNQDRGYQGLATVFRNKKEHRLSLKSFEKAYYFNPSSRITVLGVLDTHESFSDLNRLISTAYKTLTTIAFDGEVFMRLIRAWIENGEPEKAHAFASTVLQRMKSRISAFVPPVIDSFADLPSPKYMISLIEKSIKMHCEVNAEEMIQDDELKDILAGLGISAGSQQDDRANVRWGARQRAAHILFNTTDNLYPIIKYCLSGWSGFSSSTSDERIVKGQAAALSEQFTTHLKTFDMEESHYVDEASVFEIDGRRVSETFLVYYGVFLRIVSCLPSPPETILEIGSGYGGLARIFHLGEKPKLHVLVDLPESLAFAYSYLKVHFPDLEIAILSEQNAALYRAGNLGGIVLVPVDRLALLEDFAFDVCINTRSFQEMTTDYMREYMALIETRNTVRYLYSFNYFINPRETLTESKVQDGVTPLQWVPDPDQRWRVAHFEMNPYHLCAATDRRNWLELILERDPDGLAGAPDPSSRIEDGMAGFGKAYDRFIRTRDGAAARALEPFIHSFLRGEMGVRNNRNKDIQVAEDGHIDGAEAFSEMKYLARI